MDTIICPHLINLQLRCHGEISSISNLKNQRNFNSFKPGSRECLAQGKTTERWTSLDDRGENWETARPMSRKIQRLVFPRKQTPTVKEGVGLKLPTVNSSPYEFISQINVI